MKKKFLALLTCVIMAAVMIPQTAFADEPQVNGGESTMQAGRGSIVNGDILYFGEYGAKYPVLEWKVLDAEGGNVKAESGVLSDRTSTLRNEDAMLLITKDSFGIGDIYTDVPFNETLKSSAYQGSDAQKWCKDFEGTEGSNVTDAFDVKELAAIAKTSKDDKAYTRVEQGFYPPSEFKASAGILNNEKVFFLSAEEVYTYFESNEARKAGYKDSDNQIQPGIWWLRSAGKVEDPRNLLVGIVDKNGVCTTADAKTGYMTRPAFNLNLNAILFSSATGSKAGAVEITGLREVSTSEDNITNWKLTVKDPARKNFTADMVTFDNNTVAISYENAIPYDETAAPNEYISAIITDKDISDDDCQIKYYGRIGRPDSTEGIVGMNLEDKWDSGDRLYVFSEQYNGENETDYASELVEINIAPKAPTSVTPDLYGYNDIKVRWSKVSGAAGYEVSYRRSTTSSYTRLTAGTTATSYSKANLTAGAKYYFKVRPYVIVGDEKCYGTAKVSSAIYTLKKLAAPTVRKYSSSRVKIGWRNISGESGYQISKSAKKSGTSIVSTYKTTTGKSKVLKVKKSKRYYYKVRAYKTVSGKKIYGPWSAAKAYRLK